MDFRCPQTRNPKWRRRRWKRVHRALEQKGIYALGRGPELRLPDDMNEEVGTLRGIPIIVSEYAKGVEVRKPRRVVLPRRRPVCSAT